MLCCDTPIRFPKSGFRIEALTSRPSNLHGRQRRVILNEAEFNELISEIRSSKRKGVIYRNTFQEAVA